MSKPLLVPSTHARKQHWGNLQGDSLSLMLAEYATQQAGIKVFITPDNLSATQLFDNLKFFLGQSSPANELLLFPDWETLPYDQFSPHQDIISQRLYTLSRINQAPQAIIIAAASTLMHRLCPPSFLHQHCLILKNGMPLHLETLRHQLEQAGYRCVNKVLEHGEFAVRGSLIDMYPMGSQWPFRIELLDEDIESLRTFDPDTQMTLEKIKSINILPARECPLNDQSVATFRRAFREQFSGNPSQCPIYQAITDHQFPSGIEYYLPLFFDKMATFFDYLPDNASMCLIENVQTNAEQFWQEIDQRYHQRNYDVTRPLLSPEQCYINPIEFFTFVNQYQQTRLTSSPIEKKGVVVNFSTEEPPRFLLERQAEEPMKALRDHLNSTSHRCLLVVESAGRREVLLDMLKRSEITPKIQPDWASFLNDDHPINVTLGPLIRGAVLQNANVSIIVEAQWLGEQNVPQRRQIQQKAIDPDTIIRDLAELQMDAPIVHLQFGVGRYQGLQTFTHDDQINEFLIIAYAGNDKIYVPVTALHMVSRYTGGDRDHAPLHRLGSDQWQKEKKKAIEKVNDVAIELLDIYAKRDAQEGYAFTIDKLDYERFASGFPFTETDDQQRAIQEIFKDMQSSRPMDRLICGDVGFGKTEVAMRAAFIAVQNGKQVCILAPTTLLAGQHFENFRDRFAEFPVNIELLSRFRSAKEGQKVIDGLASGHIDIVIGTHKLFQKDIHFKRLGLLIIDEEHRFGVKQKEYMKSLRTHIDILCMTATPIPRTLNMAMANIRDISLISTPPAKRLAIKTFWLEHHPSTVREAVLREILRGGQVFYLHNNVQTIERTCEELRLLVPEANVQIAHGQMRERQLERIMSDFYHHRFNVLVCTTIIETGIDIPTANTIIIDRADKFGLAQLHQLRGRVGRSHHQAYAYLLTPNQKLLTPDAVKRLEAIVSLEDLGAGFILATHDLEIRGAGELLGEEQSGNMQEIGFNLYMELLEKAVHDLKSGKTPELATPLHQGPDMDLRISAIIPDDYIHDIHARLIFYKRIANAKNKDQLHALQIEMIDRFGLLPLSVKHLMLITELKLFAERLGIHRIQLTDTRGCIEFSAEPKINAGELIKLIQLHSSRYKLDGPTRLRFTLDKTSGEERIHEISALLFKLAGE